jgi:hypothetical protein
MTVLESRTEMPMLPLLTDPAPAQFGSPSGCGDRCRGTSRPAIAATRTIPIVFTTGFDPVATGLVSSLNKPDGNVTGATFYSGALGSKQVEILIELAPGTATIGLLANPALTNAAVQLRLHSSTHCPPSITCASLQRAAVW